MTMPPRVHLAVSTFPGTVSTASLCLGDRRQPCLGNVTDALYAAPNPIVRCTKGIVPTLGVFVIVSWPGLRDTAQDGGKYDMYERRSSPIPAGTNLLICLHRKIFRAKRNLQRMIFVCNSPIC